MARPKTSWQHQAMIAALYLRRRLRRVAGWTVHTAIANRANSAPTPPGWLLRGLRVEQDEHEGWAVWRVSDDSRTGSYVIGVHGGGYISEIQAMHWIHYGEIVRRSGATMIVPVYPLAPSGTAATVVPTMANLVRSTVRAYGTASVGLIGDSAGGGLAMAAVQRLASAAEPVPARMVLISPWLDGAMSDSRTRTIDDPMLDIDDTTVSGKLWAGDLDPADPRVSPLLGSLTGLPRTVVYAGSRDRLYPDTLRLQERVRSEGADISFVLREGLMHIWAENPVLPEAWAVRDEIAAHLVGGLSP